MTITIASVGPDLQKIFAKYTERVCLFYSEPVNM